MKKIKLLFKIGLFSILFGIISILSLYLYAYLSPAIDIRNAGHLYIYDDNEELVFQGSSSNKWVELEDISPNLVNAVLTAEDKHFYEHHGFDYPRIAKALLINFKNRNLSQGASTISQQYIKNLFLDFDKTWKRKAEEAILTMKLETHYSKDEILEGYLNTINYGNGNYGIENASNYYFNKSAKDLNLEEALILAGIPKSPSNYNPIANYDGTIKRANLIASLMVKSELISESDYDELFQEKIEIYGHHNTDDSTMIMYYQDAVYNELYNLKEIPPSLIETGGLKIYTSFNQDAQKKMEEAIKKNMDGDKLQVASIIVDPNNGEVMALSGGYDYAISQFNRATNAKRQVGSTIKPFLYYAALENGMVSSSTFLSEPTTFVFSENQTYSPNNFNNRYGNKNITMAAALSYSDNIYAVKTHLFLGEEMLVNTANRMGLKSELEAIPSLALGTCNITMLDFAAAYTTLASGGYKRDLTFINKVLDMDGNVLYEKKNNDELVLNTSYAYILNELMTATYNSAFKDYNNPTLISVSSKISKKYAMKTGSSGNDFWMVGYNPNALMIVWNGYDDNSELSLVDGPISKNIWVDTMENIEVNQEDNWYETPDNVVGVPHNAIDGSNVYDNTNMYIFYYIKG
ncbi:MAG: transglycosylase domain-containing protein, partial [Bacilli bacterium]